MCRILISIVEGKPVIHADEGVSVVWADRMSDLIEFRDPLVVTGGYDEALAELQEEAAEEARWAKYEGLQIESMRVMESLKPVTFEGMRDVLEDLGRANPEGAQTAEQVWDEAFASRHGPCELSLS